MSSIFKTSAAKVQLFVALYLFYEIAPSLRGPLEELLMRDDQFEWQMRLVVEGRMSRQSAH